MKISVSLPDDDVAFIDERGSNRSAVLHEAIQLMRERQLTADYTDAFSDWDSSDDAKLWDGVSGDGVSA